MSNRRSNTRSVARAGTASALESRVLLAGNVKVSLSAAGALTITGDAKANAITVVDNGNKITITEAGGGKINGKNAPITYATADVLSIKISGAGGSDKILVDSLTATTGNLTIDLGAGHDSLRIRRSFVGGKLKVTGGAGNDQVGVEGTQLLHDVTVDTGAGKDRIGVINSTFNGTMFADTGTGAQGEIVDVRDSTFVDNVMLKTQGGKDQITSINNNFLSNLLVNGGRGKDTLSIDALTTVAGILQIKKIEKINRI